MIIYLFNTMSRCEKKSRAVLVRLMEREKHTLSTDTGIFFTNFAKKSRYPLGLVSVLLVPCGPASVLVLTNINSFNYDQRDENIHSRKKRRSIFFFFTNRIFLVNFLFFVIFFLNIFSLFLKIFNILIFKDRKEKKII